MAAEHLAAYLSGRRVGTFDRVAGVVSFTFDDDWRHENSRLQLSASLPRTVGHHSGSAPENFLWGLLPDNTAVLTRWGRRFGVNSNNALALLNHVGLDCAGAVQLVEDDGARTIDRPGGAEQIDSTRIHDHLKELRSDPEAWTLSTTHEGSFSLAGAQSKFALAQTDDGWAVPWGSEPSTHIFKPGADGFAQQDVIEHVSLATAGRLGLNAASSRIVDFDGETAIVVERYDRALEDGHRIRIHQEDMCQALGLHPAGKYQNEGGPGIAAISALLRQEIRGRGAQAAVEEFMNANAYNWLISGTDAHAKNYSLIRTERRTRLAPLYDVASALPYPELHERKIKLAMSIDGEYRIFGMAPRHWQRQAKAVDVDPDGLIERMKTMAERLPDAVSDIVAELPLNETGAAFRARFVDLMAARAVAVRATLNRAIGLTSPAAASTVSAQPRKKDLGATDNRGRYAAKG
ncbi:type II toxin-antitoxin system HipA family toxin [Cryobacterium sp. HLT2-28]|uniref:type II toxin-antitoxin system HipA family toxin n=1 Tax=Cryobacterium sp. HLT2-28 TaxID=1259146 RepID=UPI00106CBE23|nr:type II toxin-antitoxin system HipA family toxin [Cryobacterium sp. HLT2-28]TFB93193.1 type II toxin-antitoxin system HipA family toxin [Cryobacterium sp. HLT2-28]